MNVKILKGLIARLKEKNTEEKLTIKFKILNIAGTWVKDFKLKKICNAYKLTKCIHILHIRCRKIDFQLLVN